MAALRPAVLRAPELARFLGVSQRTAYRHVQDGSIPRIPSAITGRSVRVPAVPLGKIYGLSFDEVWQRVDS